MSDREARDRLVAIIESYLGEQITAFEFDGAINRLADQTGDATVHTVVSQLWFYYDDITDHRVVAARDDWDLFQRLLLLLRSDECLVLQAGRREWTVRQILAAAGLVAFGLTALTAGFTTPLAVAWGLAACLATALCCWRDRIRQRHWRAHEHLYPFASLVQMLRIRRRIAGFAKTRHPAHLQARRLRDPMAELVLGIPTFLLFLVIAPLVLVYQSLPEREAMYTVAAG